MRTSAYVPCGTVIDATRLQVTRTTALIRIETTSHLMEVWSAVDDRPPRRGVAVYAHGPGDMVSLEWPGGRKLHAVARSVPVRPRSVPTAARWLAAKLLGIGAALFQDLHIVPVARRLDQRAQQVGCDVLGGVRAKAVPQ